MDKLLTTLQLDNDIVLPLGNFGWVYEATQSAKLYAACRTCEESLYSDSQDFYLNFRKALEALSAHFKVCPQTGDRCSNLISICQEVQERDPLIFASVLLAFETNDKLPASAEWHQLNDAGKISEFIRTLFRYASRQLHYTSRSKNTSETTNLSALCFFYDLMVALISPTEKSFSDCVLPVGGYYPVDGRFLEKNRLIFPRGLSLYARFDDNKQRNVYALVAKETPDMLQKDKHAPTIFRKLWEDQNPDNLPLKKEPIPIADGGFFHLYELKSQPLPIDQQYLQDIHQLKDDEIQQKTVFQLARGIVSSVSILHQADPPFYHRALALNSFLVCESPRNKRKIPILIDLNSAKDVEGTYTICNTALQMSAKRVSELIAPEVRLSLGTDIDWEKADIYSLGGLLSMVLTGSYIPPDEHKNMTVNQAFILKRMLSLNPSERPNIETVKRYF